MTTKVPLGSADAGVSRPCRLLMPAGSGIGGHIDGARRRRAAGAGALVPAGMPAMLVSARKAERQAEQKREEQCCN